MVRRLATVAVAAALTPVLAHAQFQVYVGYADGLRGSPNHPDPWFGSANVTTFIGYSGASPDAGGIMIVNTGGSNLTINALTVQIGGGYNYTFAPYIAGGVLLAPGKIAIFTGQNNSGDFDTSDVPGQGACGVSSGVNPTLSVTVNSVATGYTDSGKILNTGGYDLACTGNEALGWRLVGTTGVDNPGNQLTTTPEPGSLLLLGGGLSLLGLVGVRRRSMAA